MKNNTNKLILVFSVLALLGGCGKNTSDHDSEVSRSVKTFPAEACTDGATFPQSRFFLENVGINHEGFESYPDDLKCFTENAAMCEHFAGEEGYDEQRQTEILLALDKYCSDAQGLSLLLKKKYAHDSAISKILAVCDVEKSTSCGSFRK